MTHFEMGRISAYLLKHRKIEFRADKRGRNKDEHEYAELLRNAPQDAMMDLCELMNGYGFDLITLSTFDVAGIGSNERVFLLSRKPNVECPLLDMPRALERMETSSGRATSAKVWMTQFWLLHLDLIYTQCDRGADERNRWLDATFRREDLIAAMRVHINDGVRRLNPEQIKEHEVYEVLTAEKGADIERYAKRFLELMVDAFISIDVVRRNVVYQNKGSDDKNASFFSFKPRPGEGYDAAFFKKVVAPDLLTNLLNTFAEEEETNVEDTLHNSLNQIVVSEREMARKQENLLHREAAIGVDLKPVVDAGAAANLARETMQKALRVVKKDVALLQHFGSQDSAHAVPGLPRSIDKLMRSSEQDPRIRKAIKGMVIHREDGILILDKALSELANVEVRVISQIADRKKVFTSTLNAQVIDFACDFGFSTSGTVGGGHYRKGYTRDAVIELIPLFAETTGATLAGLERAIEMAFDTAQAQIETNPAALRLYALEATLRANSTQQEALGKEVADLEAEIEGLNTQIKGRVENEFAWNLFLSIAQYLPAELQSQPRMAKAWLAHEVSNANSDMQEMSSRRGSLLSIWHQYTKAVEDAGLEGIEGIRTRYEALTNQQRQIKNRLQYATSQVADARRKLPELQKSAMRAEQLVQQTSQRLDGLKELKGYFTVFQSYFGDVDPRDVESPILTLKKVNAKKASNDAELGKASEEYAGMVQLKASASRFLEIFGSDCNALTANPVAEHRDWIDAQNLAQQSILPLEPLMAALEEFRLKFPNQTPETWMKATDERRLVLDRESREADSSLTMTTGEIEALDNLSVVDDAAFARAWAVLGDKPQRLYVMLQSMDGTAKDSTRLQFAKGHVVETEGSAKDFGRNVCLAALQLSLKLGNLKQQRTKLSKNRGLLRQTAMRDLDSEQHFRPDSRMLLATHEY